MEQSSAQPASKLLSLQIIWGALLGTVAIYVGVSFFVPFPDPSPLNPEQIRQFEIIFALLSIMSLGVAAFLPQRIFVQTLRRKLVETAETPSSIPISKLAEIATVPSILRLALYESVTIYGLVLVFLGHTPMKIIPFAAVSALAMLSAMPREASLRRAAEAQTEREAV